MGWVGQGVVLVYKPLCRRNEICSWSLAPQFWRPERSADPPTGVFFAAA